MKVVSNSKILPSPAGSSTQTKNYTTPSQVKKSCDFLKAIYDSLKRSSNTKSSAGGDTQIKDSTTPSQVKKSCDFLKAIYEPLKRSSNTGPSPSPDSSARQDSSPVKGILKKNSSYPQVDSPSPLNEVGASHEFPPKPASPNIKKVAFKSLSSDPAGTLDNNPAFKAQ